MGDTIKLAALGAVAFIVLDGVWLGVLMRAAASAVAAAAIRSVVR